MADNAPPRAGIGAFRGGPLGIGWAPWLIGAGALVLGVYFFMRRGGTAAAAAGQPAQAGAMPLTSQPSVNVFPFPSGAQADGGASSVSAQQLNGQGAVPPTPAPPPTGTLGGSLATPATPTFWRNPVSGAIYLVNAQGKSYLSGAQWASIQSSYGGNAPYTNVDPAQLAALPTVNLAA